MEIADQLADEGKKVSLISRRTIGRGLERRIYLTLRNRLIQKGVSLYSNCPPVAVDQYGLYVVYDNELLRLRADTVVLAIGFKSENTLYDKIKGRVPEVYQVGDCVEPRDVMHAIREGAEVSSLI